MKRLIVITTLGCILIFNPAKSQNYQLANKKVKVFITSKNTNDRLSQKEDLTFSNYPQPEEDEAVVFIDDSKTFQTYLGMGGAFTDASAETFYKLPKVIQEQIIKAYFDPIDGIGYNLGRISIHSCDFSSSSFTYVNENDKELKSFSIAHDLAFRIPFIKQAQEKSENGITFFASPWSPPAWMKTNNNMLRGGKLKPEMSQTWANYYVKFVNEYEKQGIPVWGLNVQNEPMSPQSWESCTYTAEEERDFVKNYLVPTLWNNNLKRIKLMIWDHNRGLIYQRAKVVYDDPEASKYVWGAGFHWYMGDHFENIRMVHDSYPNKGLLFTEGCHYPFDSTKVNEWHWGEVYAKSIINDFNNWSVGWTDWNLILDENGGPNHVKNFCYAPIIANVKKETIQYMNSFYYIGHFSKFIKPGAKRIACSSVLDEIIATSFKNPDGKIVTVAVNATNKSFRFKLWYNSQVAEIQLPENSIATLIF